jgi:hypothetical protein
MARVTRLVRGGHGAIGLKKIVCRPWVQKKNSLSPLGAEKKIVCRQLSPLGAEINSLSPFGAKIKSLLHHTVHTRSKRTEQKSHLGTPAHFMPSDILKLHRFASFFSKISQDAYPPFLSGLVPR